jgi:sigma-B regulation protein RsbU (phosphoserine phosphatase)
MARILVVEDEPRLALGLADDLTLEGYEVEMARDGEAASQRAREQPFDLIILDVMLPSKDGFEVCRELRRAGLQTPVILLTAKSQESDKVLGLDLGANDYVTKPYSPRELRARVRAILRQQQGLLAESGRLDQEVRTAAAVQQRLLPQVRPPLATLDYAGYCHPARHVSGDYYDFLDLAPGKLGLLVADVVGKGISAALLMASIHACIRTHRPVFGEQCGNVVREVNALLYGATDPDRFATLFYGVYDDVMRRLTYSNAGHEPALLVRAGVKRQPTYMRLEVGTPPVGIFATLPAVQSTVELEEGDWLAIFSDGIPEALNQKQEEFGCERLLDILMGNRQRSAAEMRDAILSEVVKFSNGCPQSDDLTLIVARAL